MTTANNVLEREKGAPIHFVKALQLPEVKATFAVLTEEDRNIEYRKYYERVESPNATMSLGPKARMRKANTAVAIIEKQVGLLFGTLISSILTLRDIKMNYLWFQLGIQGFAQFVRTNPKDTFHPYHFDTGNGGLWLENVMGYDITTDLERFDHLGASKIEDCEFPIL